MSAILIVLIIVILVMIFVFFEVMATIGTAGYKPSRLISEIFKKKTDKIELSDTVKGDGIEPVKNEAADENEIESNDDIKVKEMIQRWRLAAGILFGLVLVFLLAFYRQGLMSGFHPWARYVFWPLIFVTVIVFIVLNQKEKKLKK